VPAKADNLSEAFDRTWDHIHSTPEERASLKNASDLVSQVREQAAKFSVTLTDAEAFKAALDLENAQRLENTKEFATGAEAMRSVAHGDPNETAKFFATVKRNMDARPVETLQWLAAQYGVSPQALGMAQAPQQQPQQFAPQDEATVQAMLDKVIPTLEGFDEDAAYELIASGKVKLTGDAERDLRNAHKAARRASAKLTPEQRLEKSMSRIYDRKMGGK
jgi:hypothetical protein